MRGMIVVAVLFAAAAVAIACAVDRCAPALAATAAIEETHLRDVGQIVAQQAGAAALRAEVARVTADNAGLSSALGAALAAARRVRIERVVSVSTGPVVASGKVPLGRPCLVDIGDEIDVRASEVQLRSEAGNMMIVGSLSAVRVRPEPVSTIATGVLSAEMARVLETPPPPPPERGWSTSLVLVVGASAFIAGAVAGVAIVL